MILNTIKSELKSYWEVSKHSSRAYKIAQGITILIIISYMLSNTVMIDLTEAKGGAEVFILRGIAETCIFLLTSHYILRSYLKLKVIHQGLSFKNLSALLLVLFLVSALSVLISKYMGEIPYFAQSQPQEFTFMIDGKEIALTMSDPKLWVFIILNQLFFFGGWALVYIVWHAIQSKREMQKQMQEARIQQLTNQLSPHFLFNTLNSIRALIYEDKDKAADLVTQLSEIFRTHLQAHLQSASTLEQEWQVAERYLTIEKARLEERLSLQCDIDEQLWQQKLPTLCVLTLIENAIKHGISPNPKQGFLHISASFLDPHHWRLQIENSVSAFSANDGTKTGLQNTRDRLELMFGNAVSFDVKQTQDNYTIILELPYDKNANS